MDKVHIGVISHAHGHINTYCGQMQHFDDAELIATWDDNKDRGRENADKFSMEFRTSADAVLGDPNIDTVMIGIETNRHAEYALMAAQAGKNILLQKPMATTLEDCDRIIEAVNKSGVKFSMAFQMRQDPRQPQNQRTR